MSRTAETRPLETAEKQQQQEEERVTKRAARFARRPLVMFFLLLFLGRFRGLFFGRSTQLFMTSLYTYAAV